MAKRISRRKLISDSGAAILASAATAVGVIQVGGCRGSNIGSKPPPVRPPHDHTSAGVATAKFSDTTTEANLDFVQRNGACERRYFCDQISSGVAMFDADGDGFLDLYFPQPKPLGVCKQKYRQPLRHRLYINDGNGKFTLKENAFGGVETDYGISAAVGDYNNDGHADLYVCCYGKDRLFKNRGDGTFEDVTDKAGVGVGGLSSNAVWFDYDGDGYLDLFVCRYVDWSIEKDDPCPDKNSKPSVCNPLHYLPARSVLYHNNGDGTFTDVTKKCGLSQVAQRSLGVAAADFHNTGRLDLFVANDMGPNFLYQNLGNGKFDEVGAEQGVAIGSHIDMLANMGVAVGDYDEDGDLDICVTTFSGQPYMLYRNDGNVFSNESLESGIADATIPMLGFGTGFFDSRNIGRLDIFFANGHVNPYIETFDPSTHWKQANQLLLNNGAGHFDWIKEALPPTPRVHKGAVFGDVDNDGRIDIVVSANDDRPTLLHNDSPIKNWVMLQLVNRYGCCTPIGTKCIATINGKSRLRVVLGGGSYGGDSDFRVHFGLDDATSIETLEIHWLSGHKQTLTNVAANKIHKIREPV